MKDYYFSERENGVQPQNSEEIPLNFWRGFSYYIDDRTNDGSFAEKFPIDCRDWPIAVGTNSKSLMVALKAEFKNIKIPFQDNVKPSDLEVLDLIEFFYKYISKPISKEYHEYFKHYHLLNFDASEGNSQHKC